MVESKERYGLTWAGKAEAFRNVQSVSSGTLAPMPSESVNWDATENLIIEGDNLEVLKLLQRPYHGQVKMIYIETDNPKFPTIADITRERVRRVIAKLAGADAAKAGHPNQASLLISPPGGGCRQAGEGRAQPSHLG